MQEKKEREKAAGIDKLSAKQKSKIVSRAIINSSDSSSDEGGQGRMQIASRYLRLSWSILRLENYLMKLGG